MNISNSLFFPSKRLYYAPGFNGLAALSPTTRRRQQDIKPNKPVNNVRERKRWKNEAGRV